MRAIITLFFLITISSFSLLGQVTITLQPDAIDGKDVILRSLSPNSNFATHPDFNALTWTNGGQPVSHRSLIEFNLSAIPQGSIVTDATLTLFGYTSPGNGAHWSLSGPNTSLLQRVIGPWQENTVTWSNQPGTTTTGQIILPQSSFPGEDYDLNVLDMVQDMVNNPSTNHGWMLRLQTEQFYRRMIFASSDNSNAAIRPRLEVTYIPSGGICNVTYSESFNQGQSASPAACNAWGTFMDELTPQPYTSVTIRGSQDMTGVTCDDPAIVAQIANALNLRIPGTFSCNGTTWRVQPGCGFGCGNAVELNAQGNFCSCTQGYTVRPSIGNSNWGGVNGPTCFAPSQTIEVDFEIACDDEPPSCNAPTVTCPPDMTATCDSDIVLDPNDAVAIPDGTNGCTIVAQWVTNPVISGVPGCDGTTYTYTYRAVDSEGNIGSCDQTWTLINEAPTLSVIPGGMVNCYEEIEVDLSDATVSASCADYNLYITAPELLGPIGCPGTEYIYTFRLVEACGRIVEADRVFIENDNAPPTITAPADAVVNCLAGINPNPNHATVMTSCDTEYTVMVSDPVISGPLDCPGTIYTYTYTVIDDCGREASDQQNYQVSNEAPVFTSCPVGWFQLNCEDNGGEGGTIEVLQAWLASVEAVSACGDQLLVANDFNENDINTCINNGINTVTFSAMDACGRTSTCEATFVVVDTEAPEFTTSPQDHYEICNFSSNANLQAWANNLAGAEAWDACSNDNINWTVSPANPTINCVGSEEPVAVTVTFIVTDNCGNKTSETATFYALPPPELDNTPGEFNSDNNEISLFQNQPNPFDQSTSISFHLPEAMDASIWIYSASGKLIKSIHGDFTKGLNQIEIDKAMLNKTGIFLYQLITPKGSLTKRMILFD